MTNPVATPMASARPSPLWPLPPSLTSVIHSTSANGTWQLKVQELAAADVGTLTAWSLQLVHQ